MPKPRPVPATRRLPAGWGTLSVRFTPAGDVLAAGHYGVKLLDAVTGEEKRVFRAGPLCWEAAVNESYVLAAFRDNVTRLWDARTGEVLADLEPDQAPPLTSALGGARALTGNSELKTLTVWEVPSGRKLRTLKLKKASALQLDITADGLRGACGDADKTVYVWDLESGTLLHELKGHTGRIMSVQFSADGTRLLSASADKTARVWDLASGAEVGCLSGHKKLVAAAVFGPGDVIATDSGEGVLRLWSGGEVTAELESGAFDGRNILYRFGFSPEGGRLVAPGYDDVAVWDGIRSRMPEP